MQKYGGSRQVAIKLIVQICNEVNQKRSRYSQLNYGKPNITKYFNP